MGTDGNTWVTQKTSKDGAYIYMLPLLPLIRYIYTLYKCKFKKQDHQSRSELYIYKHDVF